MCVWMDGWMYFCLCGSLSLHVLSLASESGSCSVCGLLAVASLNVAYGLWVRGLQ